GPRGRAAARGGCAGCGREVRGAGGTTRGAAGATRGPRGDRGRPAGPRTASLGGGCLLRLLRAHACRVRDLAEPLVDDVVVLTGLAQLRHGRLELLEHRGVALLDRGADDLARVELLDQVEAVVRLRRREDRGDVRDDGVDLAGLDALRHEAGVLELHGGDAVVGGVGLAGRRLLDAGLLALDVLDALDVRVLLRHERE